ncbi:diphthine--ammonia ligase, partial [Chloroflexota bacterium]
LREINFGEFEGLTFAEISQRYPEMVKLWISWNLQTKFPGGESVEELNVQVSKFQNLLKKHTREETVLIVAHSATLRLLLCNLLEIELKHWRQFRLELASLTILDTYPERAILSLLNDEIEIQRLKGKDSCLACYRAIVSGLEVRCLANMITEDGKRSWSHGQSPELLQVQSQAIGIPLVQQRTTGDNYEAEFKNMLLALKREGIDGGVFGDIDFEEHRQWIERVCQEGNIAPHLPLWGESQDRIMRDLIELGFEAVVVATKADLLGEEWVGRKVDLYFISHLEELAKTKDITPCGEAGEYHTFVVNGPLFKQRIEILEAKKVMRDEHWFLEISQCDLRAK